MTSKDCINCTKKNWLRIINKPVMECFLTKEQFTVIDSEVKAKDCNHYENEEKYAKF